MNLPPDVPPPSPMPTTLPPLGTSPPTFWEAPATKLVLAATLAFVIDAVCSWIVGQPISREALAAGVRYLSWGWAGAFGIQRLDTDALRWR